MKTIINMKRYIILWTVLQIIVIVHCSKLRTQKRVSGEYDFVVIGGGVAGTVVANRLSENYNWTILLLTADRNPFKAAYLDNTRKNDAPKRRNAWSWDTVSRYYSNERLLQDANLPKYTSYSEQSFENIGELLRGAYREMRVKRMSDENAFRFLKLAKPVPVDIANEYGGTNLQMVYDATVTSLDIDQSGFVRKVNFIQNNDKKNIFTVTPEKEVIISAGTYTTPKILMLSGIGREPDLEKLGIPLHCDLDVGQNLLDHIVVPYFFKMPCSDNQVLASIPGDPMQPPNFISLISASNSEKNYPNLMNTCRTVQCKDTKTMNMLVDGLPDDFQRQIHEELQNHTIIVVGIHNIKPKSRGEIQLSSKNPFEPLIIRNNLFTSNVDMNTILAGIRTQRSLLLSQVFKQYGITELTPRLAPCAQMSSTSRRFWECYVNITAMPLDDGVGTVKMGNQLDTNAVVDACFQVYGTQNLRVIDESVIPSAVTGPSYSYAEQIGERGVELIKEDY